MFSGSMTRSCRREAGTGATGSRCAARPRASTNSAPEHVGQQPNVAVASHVANATWSILMTSIGRGSSGGYRGMRRPTRSVCRDWQTGHGTSVAPAPLCRHRTPRLRLGRHRHRLVPGGPQDLETGTAAVRDLRRLRRLRSAPHGRDRDPCDVVRQAESKLRRSAEELLRRMRGARRDVRRSSKARSRVAASTSASRRPPAGARAAAARPPAGEHGSVE